MNNQKHEILFFVIFGKKDETHYSAGVDKCDVHLEVSNSIQFQFFNSILFPSTEHKNTIKTLKDIKKHK